MTRPVITAPDDGDLRARTALHSALGEPIRLAIVESLVLTDLTPQDIVDGMGIRSNLLAHHLNVLEDAGLVQRLRSDGDGRRRYLRLPPAPLAELQVRVRPLRATRVAFVCVEDAGFSQLAARKWGSRSAREARAAAYAPQSTNPAVMELAQAQGLEPLDPTTTSVADLVQEWVPELAVTLTDIAREAPDLPLINGTPLLHWSLPRNDLEAAAVELDRRLDVLALALDGSGEG